ncbi:hypothetical protein JKP88DRAFT_272940 [Tribonema minus]|uniref:Uncharacterized protein n=1 Tax=Tribonema minus TaxID=303371 RepID=A0A835Z4I8_9STRA|nr:hypothetical protein JKP88DRAFT_272940 [Tribonema minus]
MTGHQCDWTRDYKPLRMMFEFSSDNPEERDYRTLRLCVLHGVENVRWDGFCMSIEKALGTTQEISREVYGEPRRFQTDRLH